MRCSPVNSPGRGRRTTTFPCPRRRSSAGTTWPTSCSSSLHAHRVVTLVGPGGVGKTRLLIETGHRLRDARPDNSIVLCELAGADARSAVDVVAAALGIDGRLGVAPVDRIVDVRARQAGRAVAGQLRARARCGGRVRRRRARPVRQRSRGGDEPGTAARARRARSDRADIAVGRRPRPRDPTVRRASQGRRARIRSDRERAGRGDRHRPPARRAAAGDRARRRPPAHPRCR